MVSIRRKRLRAAAAAEHNDDIPFVPEDPVPPIEKLREIQEELQKVNEEFDVKVFEIEEKYSKIRKPVYARRSEIISTVPNFWMIAFFRHFKLRKLLTEEDREIFKYLDSLEVEESKDFIMDYCITFNFKPNPFFENSKLTKTVSCSNYGTRKVTGTTIKWKKGQGLVADVIYDKENRNKGLLSKESFFKWFSDTQNEEVKQYVVADLIKNDLWRYPALSLAPSLQVPPRL